MSPPQGPQEIGAGPGLAWREGEQGCNRGQSPGGLGSQGMNPPPSRVEAFKYGLGPGTQGAAPGSPRRVCGEGRSIRRSRARVLRLRLRGPERGAVRAGGIEAVAALGAWKWVSAVLGLAAHWGAPGPRRDVEGTGRGVRAAPVAPCARSEASSVTALGLLFWALGGNRPLDLLPWKRDSLGF